MIDPSPHSRLPTAGNDASFASPTPAQRRRLQQRFDQASRTMEQPVYDARRVHDVLAECVAQEPGNASFAAALLRNLRRVPHIPGEVSADELAEQRERLAQAAARQDWPEVLKQGIAVLPMASDEVTTLLGLARACQNGGCPESAMLYVTRALEAEPTELEIHRLAARVSARLGDIDGALSHWQHVEHADPRDEEASRMISALTLEKIRRPPPEEDTKDEAAPSIPEGLKREVPPEKAAFVPDETLEPHVRERPRSLVLTPRQQLEKAIADHPEDETLYLELAELHLAEGRLYEAQRTLARAVGISSELHVREKLEDVNLLRARQQARLARQHAEEERTVDALEMAEKLENDLQQLEFDTVRVRCERYPDDKSLRFRLGVCWKRRGDFRQALEPLKAGLEVPEHRAAASLEIGEILQRYKQLPKALQCYRQSAQLASLDPQDEDIRRVALYRAGLLATEMKLYDSARLYLEALAKTDSTYKDVRARLDKLNEIDETV
jgi:tetratricopeptide (TPR) repeat protein